MKNNFLTIPGFPNYEINSRLVVRNKKTQKILRQITDINGRKTVNLYCNGKPVQRVVSKLFENARSAHWDWQPIPSLNNLYEIARNGSVRNARTKNLIKKLQRSNKVQYQFGIGGKVIWRTLESLLWEVRGIVPKKNHYQKIAVTIRKGHERLFFKSFNKAAAFLAKRCFVSESYLKSHFTRRCTEILDWTIAYHFPR